MTEQHIAGTVGILGAVWLGLPLVLLAVGKQVAVTVSSAKKAA